ncbi:hypothetical protein BJ166DRAFT_134449 [Pestalotiopsis sp. NC0098]|nr:hypothetical protein BJ166DRAFT_134449 [Pestalotiopsis sp. NC0098]
MTWRLTSLIMLKAPVAWGPVRSTSTDWRVLRPWSSSKQWHGNKVNCAPMSSIILHLIQSCNLYSPNLGSLQSMGKMQLSVADNVWPDSSMSSLDQTGLAWVDRKVYVRSGLHTIRETNSMRCYLMTPEVVENSVLDIRARQIEKLWHH